MKFLLKFVREDDDVVEKIFEGDDLRIISGGAIILDGKHIASHNCDNYYWWFHDGSKVYGRVEIEYGEPLPFSTTIVNEPGAVIEIKQIHVPDHMMRVSG